MAFNGSRGINATNNNGDQQRLDSVLAPYRKNRKLLRVKNLPFAETRDRVEAFLKSKLTNSESASFNWPPSGRTPGHDGVVFISFRERNDCVRADRDLKGVIYPGQRGPRELIVQLDRGRTLAIPAAARDRIRSPDTANSTTERPEQQVLVPASSPGITAEVPSLSRTAQQQMPLSVPSPGPTAGVPSVSRTTQRYDFDTARRAFDYIESGLAAPTDAERMRLSQEFFTNEMKIRSERYGNDGGLASEISGAVVSAAPPLSSPAPARTADEISSSAAPTVLMLNPRPANPTGISSRTEFQTWKAFVGAPGDSDDDDENNGGARLGYY
ncbi:hypothetical protein HER10_EVM0010318 [Colletotrichum scovillei]|uniref:RRM domain-containing protein n=1 Tax=Colletotrichum scovillei TaxID=1209932 RepID=A0A9P7R909_9PEZI|nr:uncharacterized protein HER10_EVM0010318 [Colletotrichum scovillei]KAF4783470.1 hypothetical protein HER10_EVM0010318 [Colletotrichum scovillei]KAG7051099.1 hypothetical protein JMJ77_0001726 [Colletotrichum scovillei]KAG7070134.1 hypothetical protein JMJ76_0001391 [Colletotrichum scovillei]KAG7078382.1 hypothetical protein JMJ78_0002054 [Colletotrichum scovillei]